MEFPKINSILDDKYSKCTIRWIDKHDHYELVFTDDFVTPSSSGRKFDAGIGLPPLFGNALLTDIIIDMRDGDKDKEVHVFIGSFGGEVAALNMILQQLLTYKYRVGINLGTACSCGWMLFFACQERYVSPFSQAMYHDISSICMGKHSEMQRSAEFISRWQKELLKCTDAGKFLTPRELELGQTSEVWFTGRELVERGAARDYSEYLTRRIPFPVHNAARVKNDLYVQDFDGTWSRFVKTDDAPLTYPELLARCNARQEPPADASAAPRPPKAARRKKAAGGEGGGPAGGR